jgi:hypothetical protein
VLRRSSSGRARRSAIAALSLCLIVLATSFGHSAPARADHREDHQPVARLQIVITRVYIANDRDRFGAGEMTLEAAVIRCPSSVCQWPQVANTGQVLAYARRGFSASSGDTVPLDRVLPGAEDRILEGYEASGEIGLAVYEGERYLLRFDMSDDDPSGSDYLGRALLPFVAEGNWEIGSHSIWSQKTEEGVRGDYRIDVEIRRAPLPNLRPSIFRKPDGSGDFLYCAEVVNDGELASEPFQLGVYFQGARQRTITSPSALDVQQRYEHCLARSELPEEEHDLEFRVDPDRRIAERDELDNAYRWKMMAVQGASGGQGATSPQTPQPPSTPAQPSPTPAQADLTVTAIKVRGTVPDGKDDCKEGKNDVAVVVRNGGAAGAGPFTVRLVVDGEGDEAEERTVATIDAGQEREVRFDDVRLKKGQRTLTATADAAKAVAERNEDNNERTVTATCKDDD